MDSVPRDISDQRKSSAEISSWADKADKQWRGAGGGHAEEGAGLGRMKHCWYWGGPWEAWRCCLPTYLFVQGCWVGLEGELAWMELGFLIRLNLVLPWCFLNYKWLFEAGLFADLPCCVLSNLSVNSPYSYLSNRLSCCALAITSLFYHYVGECILHYSG